jgi:hypothetical protein
LLRAELGEDSLLRESLLFDFDPDEDRAEISLDWEVFGVIREFVCLCFGV